MECSGNSLFRVGISNQYLCTDARVFLSSRKIYENLGLKILTWRTTIHITFSKWLMIDEFKLWKIYFFFFYTNTNQFGYWTLRFMNKRWLWLIILTRFPLKFLFSSNSNDTSLLNCLFEFRELNFFISD